MCYLLFGFGMMSCLLLREKEEVAARINYELFMCLLVFCVCMTDVVRHVRMVLLDAL